MATTTVTVVKVNFIFANYEKKVVLSTTLSSSGSDLKTQLLQNWPEGSILIYVLLMILMLIFLSVLI